jgi:hypothetical protein
MSPQTPVFVFGSNLAGRHGKGAALYARQHHGAIYGQGEGLQGNSYGIPTKDASIRTLPLEAIAEHVMRFKAFAAEHPEKRFQVTAIGCGLAGYTAAQIAPLFCGTPSNSVLPQEFVAVLETRKMHARDSDR